MVAVEWHRAFEGYCEAIYELREDDIEVIQARIAERLQVSRPSVSEMMRRMETQGLVTVRGGVISLTQTGRKMGEQVVRRHRLAERFLTDVLGLSWAEAHHEAGKWEHVISESVEAAMVRILGQPDTCPHGNPIPGHSGRVPNGDPLSSVPVGNDFTVMRIPEELEFAEGMLEFLESAGVKPGRMGRVVNQSPDGTVTVDMDGAAIGLGVFVSSRVVVKA